MAVVTCVLATSGAVVAAGRSAVRISGVHFDGMLKGRPEPDCAIRLTNTDTVHAADIGGFALSEELTPERSVPSAGMSAGDGSGRARTERNRETHRVVFPTGAKIPPGGDVWVAAEGEGFLKIFGDLPAFEGVDTRPDVDNLLGDGFLRLSDDRGTVALLDGHGELVDFVPYETTAENELSDAAFAQTPWRGLPVRVEKSSFYGWKGQILARDRDETGHLLPDTHSAADWDSGFSRKRLGDEPTHRIELAGQSHFLAQPLRGVRARVLATSAPDNNHKALLDAFESARKSIRVRIYEMTNPRVVAALVKARLRGVAVTIYLEGSPVGGIADQERWLVDRAAKAGVAVWFLATTKESKLKPRYRFDHSKYVIIDDEKVVIGSENYGRTGVPAETSYGNRGWMVHVENPAFVKQLRAVWDADFRPGRARDLISIDASANDAYGLPYRDPAFVPDETVVRGQYEQPRAPVLVDDKMDLELVLSPDTSLNEHSALIGLIGRATTTLYVEQNSIRRRWGRKADGSDPNADDKDDIASTPNLALQAVIAAARRGVAVRVLLDSTWYNVQGDEDRDNDDTVVLLNNLARAEGLDLDAKVINLETTHLEKVHTKGVIVDGREVFIGSINWTENSFKGNREVGVVVGHPKVAGYYAALFLRDWAKSRIYSAPVVQKTTVYTARTTTSPVLARLGRGDTATVVGEHGVTVSPSGAKQAAWIEVSLGLSASGEGITGFVTPPSLGTPEALPGEALHVIGRDAFVRGRVAATSVSERRVQLRFADEQRPPFTAIIFKKDEQKFIDKGMNPASAFQGRELRLHGRVAQFRGPEIVLDDPSQVEIVR